AICYSRTKTAIIEEYKSGIEISADYYIERGKAKYLSATASLKIRSKDCFTIICSDYPAIDEEQEKRITQIAQQISQVFNLDDCPLLMQLIVNGEDINIIEFSARMGGGAKYKLIEVLSGENIMKKYVDLILGEKPSFAPQKQVNYCKMVYLYCYPGKFDHVEGFEELKSQGYIDEYFLYKTKGMRIDKAKTSGDRPAGYLVTADNKEDMKSKISHIDETLKVISSDSIDIMMHGLIEIQ
ncbi:MAG: ATP-grasp domain-containing protein, partial [Prevotella sp.]|nr:ATP-grasp domain-containing protein [Prevotella sp.]